MGRGKRFPDSGAREDWSMDGQGGAYEGEESWKERERRRLEQARDDVKAKLKPWMKVVR